MLPYLWALPIVSWKFTPPIPFVWCLPFASCKLTPAASICEVPTYCHLKTTLAVSFFLVTTYCLLRTWHARFLFVKCPPISPENPPAVSLIWCPPIVTWKLSPPPLLLQGCESQLGGGVLHPQARCGRGNLQLRPAVLIWIFSGRVMPETECRVTEKVTKLSENLGECHQEIINIEEN